MRRQELAGVGSCFREGLVHEGLQELKRHYPRSYMRRAHIRKGYPIVGSTGSNKTQHERRQPVSFVLILSEANRKQGVSTVYVKGTLPGGGGDPLSIANKLQTRKR